MDTHRAGRKRKGSGAERLTEILDAARYLYADRGVEGITTREIAAQVGISQSTLFTYYKCKDDILQALMRHAFAELSTSLKAAARENVNLESWLRGILSSYLTFSEKYPNEYRIAFMIVKPHSEQAYDDGCGHQEPVRTVALPVFSEFQAEVQHAIDSELIRGDTGSARLVAQLLWTSMHGIAALLLARPKPHFDWDDSDKLINAYVQILSQGLATRS